MNNPTMPHHLSPFFLLLLVLTLPSTITGTAATGGADVGSLSSLPSDAVSLLAFKSKADLDNRLLYTINERFDYCQWQGVKCAQGRVVRYVAQSFGLRGTIAAATLSRLDQLRVLSLKNNSLFGPLPDLSPLINLKTLFLDHNHFTGSRSSRAKPLHWTSCLKIAEDVAQGLAYIHQASKFIHGNLKSTNVLLGSDFEACVTDYCLAVLADTSLDDDPDSSFYKAPEMRKSAHKATAKSDVYAFGVLLLELLTGKPPSQHPFLAPPDMPDWVRAMREDNSEDDTRLRMLVEVASLCSLTSPEQRPTMWQVLKMITNIKEIMDDSSRDLHDGYS